MHKNLNIFIGKWSIKGNEVNFLEECEWLPGNKQVLCRFTDTSGDEIVTGMSILSYSEMNKAYTYYGINSLGRNVYQLGKNDNTKWTFTREIIIEGEKVLSRTSIIFSDDGKSADFLVEHSKDGEWELVSKDILIKLS